MISTNDFRTGMTILHNDNIYQVLEFQHSKTARGQAHVRTRLKNLRTGAIIDHTFGGAEKIPRAIINKKKMQYLYNAGGYYTFMDTETFEQLEIAESSLEYEKNFLLESMNVTIIDYQGEILGIELPEKVTLEVVEAPPSIKGNTAGNATKKAVVETGYRVAVPLFVEAGEKIVISTLDGKYSSRA